MSRSKLPRGNCLNCAGSLDRREKRYCNLRCQQESDNLRLLCPNHHALTSSYGALNRGKGRPYHMVKRALL